MSNETRLDLQAQALAEELAESVSSFLGRDVHFDATARGSRIVVQKVGDPLTMCVRGRPLMSCEINYLCRYDHVQEYLAVHSSTIKIHGSPQPKGDPLFRYEYVYDQADHLPAAHLHVHAHRDHFTHVMTLAAEAGAPHRQPGKSDSLNVARMSTVHFPLGGHRFRPSVEDVLQMIHTEFGVDVGPEWPQRLEVARLAYRREQTRAVVRDCPGEAVDVLTSMGYKIEVPPAGEPSERVSRLLAF